MPALDSLLGGGAVHISDQNKARPIKTLCGQALDKETTRYFYDRTNFPHATCKVCRAIFFDESWSGEQQTQESQDKQETPARNNLFGNLTKPVNIQAESNNEKLLDGFGPAEGMTGGNS